jgi:hypothetical protein
MSATTSVAAIRPVVGEASASLDRPVDRRARSLTPARSFTGAA